MGDNFQPDEHVQASPPGVAPTHRAEPTTGDNFELWKSVHETFPGRIGRPLPRGGPDLAPARGGQPMKPSPPPKGMVNIRAAKDVTSMGRGDGVPGGLAAAAGAGVAGSHGSAGEIHGCFP